jgi:ABC-2 type transport system ATP-binding protein
VSVTTASDSELVVSVVGVSQRFGEVLALDSVSLALPRGQVLALLGHNGAGKTTLVNILATLLPATSGEARVAGYDVRTQSLDVRRRIGLTGQFAAVDGSLSGHENLTLIGRLLGLSPRRAGARAEELLAQFDLVDAAGRAAATYSGGMRRRLDIAASLVGDPEVLFLDEPTTGLDPVAKHAMWEHVDALISSGTSILLTTQDLDEADRLADQVVVLSHGSVVGRGTASALKAKYGEQSVIVTLADPDRPLDAAFARLSDGGFTNAHRRSDGALVVAVASSADLLPVAAILQGVRVAALTVELVQPTLDDVYFALTVAPTTSTTEAA